MKLQIVRLLATALLMVSSAGFALGFGGFLGNLVADTLPVEELGSTLYDVQEGVHDTVTRTTGISVPHYYLPVCFSDECLYVDPIRFFN